MQNIQNKGLDESEIEELKKIWLFLMIKGSSLNQVRIKLNPTDSAKLKNHHYYQLAIRDNDPNLYFQLTFLSERSEKLFNNAGDLNDDSLNQIYDKHKNDEIGQILQPLINDLIPYYKSLITPEGTLNLTLEISEYYGPLKNSSLCIVREKYQQTEPRICPAYFKKIPIKIANSPGESYQILLDRLIYIYRTNYYQYCFCDKLPFYDIPDLEEVSEINTVENQKYFVAWILCKKVKDMRETFGSILDASFILSLLNWKIDIDSPEARIIEEKMNKTIQMFVKEFKHTKLSKIQKMINAKYIIKNLLPATEPLDQNEFKKKILKTPADCNIA